MQTARMLTNPMTLLAFGILERSSDTFRLENVNGETVFTGTARDCVKKMHSIGDDMRFNRHIPDAEGNNYGMRIFRCLNNDSLI